MLPRIYIPIPFAIVVVDPMTEGGAMDAWTRGLAVVSAGNTAVLNSKTLAVCLLCSVSCFDVFFCRL